MIYLTLFFSFAKIGFSSFGGLSLVPVINQEMLTHGWMTLNEVSDIIAIAEMTPGSLGINCATFAGIRVAGLLGGVCATLGVMTPSLTLCLVASVFIARFKNSPLLAGVMTFIRPICLGMICATALILMRQNFVGDGFSILWPGVAIAVICGLVLWRLKWSVPLVVTLAAVLGLALVR